MKRVTRFAVGGSLFALVLATSIAGADDKNQNDKKKEQDKFCTDVTALKDDLNGLDSLGANVTIHQIKTVRDQIKKDGDSATGDAKKIDTQAAKDFSESVDRLNRELQQIPENMPAGQMSTRLKADVQTVNDRMRALESESNCPASGGAQQQRQSQTQMPPQDQEQQRSQQQPESGQRQTPSQQRSL